MNNVEVRLRVEMGLKKEADRVFQNMGMTMSEAIRIFLMQSVNSAGLPFRPHLAQPNMTSMRSFEQKNDFETEEMSISEFSNYLKDLDNEKN